MPKDVLTAVARDSALAALAQVQEVPHLRVVELTHLCRLNALLADFLEATWEAVNAALAEGVEAGTLLESLGPLRDAIDAQLGLASALASRNPRPDAEQAGCQARLARLHDAVADLRTFVTAPRPPIDQERLARGRAEAARGEVEGGDEILARLRAGGEP
jgi:hypothetical protein